jgi:signal transduction histidine kinase
VSRIPIRLRVTLAFTAVMAVVLAVVGLFLYLRLADQLNESIDQGLLSRGAEASTLVRAASGGRLDLADQNPLIESDESFAQVLDADGAIVDSTPQLGDGAVLDADQLTRALEEPTFFEQDVPGIEGTARLLAAPVDTGAGALVAIVGSSLEDRDESLASLAALLALGGTAALVLASLAGYWAAASALRPVEAMRRRAARISAGDPGERLPVGAPDDEIARLGETLNQMLGRLEAAFERERRFVDDASHELRTPLALHKTELELALRYADDEAQLRAAIGSSVEEIDRLIQLAEDLLVVARSDENGLPLSVESIAAADLFATVAERFAARADAAGRRVMVEAGGFVIEGDRLRLEQALTSLVDNSLRHGYGDVRLWARLGEGGIELHVSDHGAGFPPAFLERAFERFSRADGGRSGRGSGLGLAIVEAIAAAHGGRARAANADAGGADVWIELP